MFLQPFQISRKSLVADIVANDYRTAEVFRKHGIGYCCGGKWPMEIACEMQGVNSAMLQKELEIVTRTNQLSNLLDFADCDTDFVIDYIVNVHHRYFTNEHVKKFTYLKEVESQFDILVNELNAAMQQEEEVIFPYLRHLAHAYKHKEPYAALLIKTLRKPLADTMGNGHETVSGIIMSIRKLTGNYIPPEKVCISHKVVMAKLKELDNDLMQHLNLEQSILIPRAIAIEQELVGT